MVKRLPTMQETRVQFLGQEDLLEKEMATHSSILAWRIPWMEKPGRLQSMESQRVGHDWATSPSPSIHKNDTIWHLSFSFWVTSFCMIISKCIHVAANSTTSIFYGWVVFHCWRRPWQPTPVLLPGKSHGRRSLVGCSPWGREESDMTERLHFHFSLTCTGEGNGNPLQCSCLENPRDGGAWWAACLWGCTESDTTEAT